MMCFCFWLWGERGGDDGGEDDDWEGDRLFRRCCCRSLYSCRCLMALRDLDVWEVTAVLVLIVVEVFVGVDP